MNGKKKKKLGAAAARLRLYSIQHHALDRRMAWGELRAGWAVGMSRDKL